MADGMGGHEAGEVASQLASETIGEILTEQFDPTAPYTPVNQIKALLTDAIETANETVHTAAKEAQQKRQMGCTIVVALLRSSLAYLSHVGDARAYLAYGSRLTQLTEDDSWGAKFSGTTLRTRAEHILTKAVGQDSLLEPSFKAVPLAPADWLLLCSDGLWNMVSSDQILATLQKADDDPQQAVDQLIHRANEAGGKDNISVAVLKFIE